MAAAVGRTAMVLAAGLGTRMQPITDHLPKPLVDVGGKTLLDYALNQLADAQVEKVVVNVHHLGDQIEAHLARRATPQTVISDEREHLLDTGGGIAHALAHLGTQAFFVSNGDSLWIDGPVPLLDALRAAWREEDMDCLLSLAPCASLGYEGAGDFHLAEDGRLVRIGDGGGEVFVTPGIYLVHPRLFEDAPQEPFSMNLLWNRAIAKGRLFGLCVAGEWMHVGTLAALAEAQARLLELSP